MKLFMIPSCPFVHRVLIGLSVRKIGNSQIQAVEIDLQNPPAELLKINPTGSVPTLQFDNGDGFGESLAVLQFIDTLDATGPKLYGKTPLEAAKNSILIENLNNNFTKILQQFIYACGNKVQLRTASRGAVQALSFLEASLTKAGTRFFGGENLNAVDAALAPFVYRFFMAREKLGTITFPLENFPMASKYMSDISTHPVVKETGGSQEMLAESLEKFMKPSDDVKRIQDASRDLVTEPEAKLRSLNEFTKSLDPDGKPWRIVIESRGLSILKEFTYTNDAAALKSLGLLNDLQETADHHSNFQFENFKWLTIALTTHDPRWGLSEKDFVMAEILTKNLIQK